MYHIYVQYVIFSINDKFNACFMPIGVEACPSPTWILQKNDNLDNLHCQAQFQFNRLVTSQTDLVLNLVITTTHPGK